LHAIPTCTSPICMSHVFRQLIRILFFTLLNYRKTSNKSPRFLLVQISTLCLLEQHCWLGGRKGIRPIKNWVVGCWRGYVSGSRCRVAYGPADAAATHYLLLW